MSASPLGLLLLDERGYVITSYQIRRHIADESTVDSEGIKRAGSRAKAYGAVLTFDKGVYANGLSIEPDVVESVRAALEEVGVRLLNQSFSSRMALYKYQVPKLYFWERYTPYKTGTDERHYLVFAAGLERKQQLLDLEHGVVAA